MIADGLFELINRLFKLSGTFKRDGIIAPRCRIGTKPAKAAFKQIKCFAVPPDTCQKCCQKVFCFWVTWRDIKNLPIDFFCFVGAIAFMRTQSASQQCLELVGHGWGLLRLALIVK